MAESQQELSPDKAINELSTMFPNIDSQSIRAVFITQSKRIDRTIEALLKLQDFTEEEEKFDKNQEKEFIEQSIFQEEEKKMETNENKQKENEEKKQQEQINKIDEMLVKQLLEEQDFQIAQILQQKYIEETEEIEQQNEKKLKKEKEQKKKSQSQPKKVSQQQKKIQETALQQQQLKKTKSVEQQPTQSQQLPQQKKSMGQKIKEGFFSIFKKKQKPKITSNQKNNQDIEIQDLNYEYAQVKQGDEDEDIEEIYSFSK